MAELDYRAILVIAAIMVVIFVIRKFLSKGRREKLKKASATIGLSFNEKAWAIKALEEDFKNFPAHKQYVYWEVPYVIGGVYGGLKFSASDVKVRYHSEEHTRPKTVIVFEKVGVGLPVFRLKADSSESFNLDTEEPRAVEALISEDFLHYLSHKGLVVEGSGGGKLMCYRAKGFSIKPTMEALRAFMIESAGAVDFFNDKGNLKVKRGS